MQQKIRNIQKAVTIQRSNNLYRQFSSKIYKTAIEATEDIKSGQRILVGGFGLVGVPFNLIQALKTNGQKDLDVVSNECGIQDWGLAILLEKNQIRKLTASYIGVNHELQRKYFDGEIEIEFVPQGSLAQKFKSGGAGIPAFYTKTGVGTVVQFGGFPQKYVQGLSPRKVEIYSQPHDSKVINGQKYLLEESITGDYSLIKGWRADEKGNIQFRKSARNFNPDIATAGKICIAEVEEIVPNGHLDPDQIHLPSIYVQRIVVSEDKRKKIEHRTFATPGEFKIPGTPEEVKKKTKIAKRVVQEMKQGMNVNLGIGIPSLCVNFIDPNLDIFLQSENGILGLGPYPPEDEIDADLISAGKQTVSVLKGGTFLSSSDTFGMIRGSHLDLTVLGGMEVSQDGDLANWIIPDKLVKGMGGAMDLVSGTKKVIVAMEHLTKKGESKIHRVCRLPITGRRVVNLLVTEMAVFEFKDDYMILKEMAEGVSLDKIKESTEGQFLVSPDLKTF